MGRTAERSCSNFAVTCSLLSQYIKGKAQHGLASRPPQIPSQGRAEAFRPPTTMSLLPGLDDKSDTEISNRNATPDARADKSQLTIFYGGKVIAFDNFPAEKARDLMRLADKCSSKPQNSCAFVPEIAAAANRQKSPPAAPTNNLAAAPPVSAPALYLPIARNQSLNRFLQKRKERIKAMAPYRVSNGGDDSIKKEEEEQKTGLWFGLDPQAGLELSQSSI